MAKVEFFGKMPNPFQRADGSLISPSEWESEKQKIRDFVIDFEYGGMPPKPELVEFELLNHPIGRGSPFWYRVSAGTRERQINFLLELSVPTIDHPCDEEVLFFEGERFPVLLTGDMCYTGMDRSVIAEANGRGYIATAFNRLELCKDKHGADPDWKRGGLHEIYPEFPDFSAISAWAWG